MKPRREGGASLKVSVCRFRVRAGVLLESCTAHLEPFGYKTVELAAGFLAGAFPSASSLTEDCYDAGRFLFGSAHATSNLCARTLGDSRCVVDRTRNRPVSPRRLVAGECIA